MDVEPALQGSAGAFELDDRPGTRTPDIYEPCTASLQRCDLGSGAVPSSTVCPDSVLLAELPLFLEPTGGKNRFDAAGVVIIGFGSRIRFSVWLGGTSARIGVRRTRRGTPVPPFLVRRGLGRLDLGRGHLGGAARQQHAGEVEEICRRSRDAHVQYPQSLQCGQCGKSTEIRPSLSPAGLSRKKTSTEGFTTVLRV